MMTPQNMYQAGASGLPVARISHATRNCVEPPKTEMASAYIKAIAPERTRWGSDSVIATMIVAEDSVDRQPNTAHALYNAALVRRWSSIQKAGKTAMARKSQGTIMIGLRPKRSDSQPPRESQTTPLKPMTAVAPKAIFADIPSVTLA